MTILDIVIILILLMFTVVGFKRGVIREAVSLVGIILIFIISYALKGYIGNFFALIFPFIKFPGSNEAMNILFYQATAFILIFGILLSFYEIIIKISKYIQKLVNLTIILILPSKILGALVGFIKGYILVYLIIIFLMIPLGGTNFMEDSTISNKIIFNTPGLSDYTNSFIISTKEIIDTTFTNNKKSIKDVNYESIDILLKYNVIDVKTVEDLVKLNKIKIDKVDKLIKEYKNK